MSCSRFSNFEFVHDITNKDGKWWVGDLSSNKLWFSWELSKTKSVKMKTNSLESKCSDSLKIFNKTLRISFGVQITNILDTLAAFTRIASSDDLRKTFNIQWSNFFLLPVAAVRKLMVRDVNVGVSSHHAPNLFNILLSSSGSALNYSARSTKTYLCFKGKNAYKNKGLQRLYKNSKRYKSALGPI